MVRVMLDYYMVCIALSMDLIVLYVACLRLFGETIRNMFGCCYFVFEC